MSNEPQTTQEEIVVTDAETTSEEALEQTIEETLTQQIQLLEKEVTNWKDLYLREKAEVENFKRRTREEQERMLKFASQSVLEDLLPVLDNLERALGASATASEEVQTFLKGFEMIQQQLLQATASAGLSVIEAAGKEFDPNFHQAVMQVEEEGIESNIVVEELQKGYTYKDRVLRATMVKVNK
ncbi:MAG: nucleotide exchange factor GrpE [Culicoidibacterales bacterium]